MSGNVRLISGDGTIHEVTRKGIRRSLLLRQIHQASPFSAIPIPWLDEQLLDALIDHLEGRARALEEDSVARVVSLFRAANSVVFEELKTACLIVIARDVEKGAASEIIKGLPEHDNEQGSRALDEMSVLPKLK